MQHFRMTAPTHWLQPSRHCDTSMLAHNCIACSPEPASRTCNHHVQAAVCARPEVTQLLEQALETHQDWDVQVCNLSHAHCGHS